MAKRKQNNEGFEMLPENRDPYSTHIGKWVDVNGQGQSFCGKYQGISVKGDVPTIVLRPSVVIEIDKSDDEKRRYRLEKRRAMQIPVGDKVVIPTNATNVYERVRSSQATPSKICGA